MVNENLTKKRKISFYLRKYLYLFIGAIITAVGLEIFLIPNNIIDGGVVGIAIMLSAVTGLPFGMFLIVINLPFLFLGYKYIGKHFAIATTFSVICLSFWSNIFLPVLPVTNDFFLAAVFGGIITGAGVGIVIRNGASFDGTEIVAIITDRKTVFSVGEIVMFINLFILSSASFVFGWDKAMYSLVAYFVISKMIDVVIKGLEETYAVMIVTSQHDEITDKLMKQMDKGVTLLHGEGGYSKEKRKILYCIVTRLEIDSLKSIVLDIDEAAFITINPVSDIVGGRLRRKKRH
ncbi:YitT family protein [Megamonas hypermegale]|uniref:YitT family protein n=1 Tax=Megamonas hypermegale TaxID=158847 RepID=A0A921HMU3_9FIRM|nr:YitT family protein [Megamonas hypermegale]MDM8143784.1 YitT family protein [Megamonas hypermegale]HJF85357.1 YitT family protein [Megamonas hypermegale]